MIDIDEEDLSVDGSNRAYGSTLTGERVREVGPHSKSDKVTLLLAIRGKIYSLIFHYSRHDIF